MHKNNVEDIWVGGLLGDGLANSLEEQAMGSLTESSLYFIAIH
jgi:hypothetical protein